jgi:superfamily II DNA helicase RecQ
MDGGFSLTITPLLSLGADQEEKLTSRAKQTTGRVVSVHLDEIRALSDQQELINELKLIPPDGHTTVVLFSSPQALLNKTFLWKPFLSWLIENDRLSMVCVDEVHLFVHFGLTFRTEFKQLTPILFDKLKVPGSSYRTTIPLLFMTGTCSKTIVTMIEKITGIGFDTDTNVFWPPASELKHRHVFFDVAYTIQALSLFKKKVGPLLKEMTTDKFILYTNTRATVERITPKLTNIGSVRETK